MQILAIVLYNDAGEIRELEFNLGRVNIITGESKTGKTAIIDIVNYCLGSDDCKVREGVIRDTVSWFGLRVQLANEQVFIARQNPSKLNLQSTGNIYFSNADSVERPALSELKNNSNIDTLKAFFGKKIGIAEYTNTPPEQATREPLPVNFKHSRYYSFQPQYLIAQPDYLFFNQTDQFVPQSIKDTLPYFLGAVREDSIKIEQQIASKRKELTRATKEYRENQKLKEQTSKRLYELVEEAKQVKLLEAGVLIESNEHALSLLKTALNWENDITEAVSSENENLRKLLEEKNQLTKDLTFINEDINAVLAFEKNTSGYTNEARKQKVRLETINLYKPSEAQLHTCPLCSSDLETEIPSITSIKQSLQSLSENLQTTQAEAPRISKYVEGLNLRKQKLIEKIDVLNNSIKQLYKEQDEAAKYREGNIRKGKVIGRISLVLETHVDDTHDNNNLERIDKLSREILELEELISGDEKESLLSAALNRLNIQMTKWKDLLDLEYGEAPIRFDLKKLNLFADTNNKSIPLSQMGSGANWVAYHLLIHFALHKLFIQDNRPTPRFLILDQPSQVYFPPEKDLNNSGEVTQSSDETAVRQMFDFVLSVTRELYPDFQVIVTDHANIKTDEFQSAIIEEWRFGQKLIPLSWIK